MAIPGFLRLPVLSVLCFICDSAAMFFVPHNGSLSISVALQQPVPPRDDRAAQTSAAVPPRIVYRYHDEQFPNRVDLLQRAPPLGDGSQISAAGRDPFAFFEPAFLQTLDAPELPSADFLCLREAIYHEARGEDIVGQFAVAEVVLNRVDSTRFPSTVCDVVYQNRHLRNACQFSYACDLLADTLTDPRASHLAGIVAHLALQGFPRLLTDGATHYHAVYVSPSWGEVYQRTARYGAHVFYRSRPYPDH